MSIAFEFISGCMVGLEIISGKEIGEDGGTYVVVDLFIVRFVINF